MTEILTVAIPFFVLFVVVEALSYRFAPDDGRPGYGRRDTTTSLAMGLGSLVVGVVWKALGVVVYAAVLAVTPLHLDPSGWWFWPALLVAEDLCFYAYHRAHHEVRLLWASHVVHHSSVHFNFSTALRQPWVLAFAFPFWVPLAVLGVPLWAILVQQSVSLLYQFLVHTERVGTLWRPVELVLNTPSHHRVHHASNPRYLDRNYGGILIVWDRLFGTFQVEDERCVYGLTTNIASFNPLTVVSHEYRALWRDVRAAAGWRDRVGHVVHGPGWRPSAALGEAA